MEDGIATFKDRVNLQKIHNMDLQAVGETAIPDQGIVFDDDRMPRDMKPEQGLLREGFRLAGGRGWSHIEIEVGLNPPSISWQSTTSTVR